MHDVACYLNVHRLALSKEKSIHISDGRFDTRRVPSPACAIDAYKEALGVCEAHTTGYRRECAVA